MRWGPPPLVPWQQLLGGAMPRPSPEPPGGCREEGQPARPTGQLHPGIWERMGPRAFNRQGN